MNLKDEEYEHIHISYADKNRTEPPTEEEMKEIKQYVREVKEKRNKTKGDMWSNLLRYKFLNIAIWVNLISVAFLH